MLLQRYVNFLLSPTAALTITEIDASINTWRAELTGGYFADDILKCTLVNKQYC